MMKSESVFLAFLNKRDEIVSIGTKHEQYSYVGSNVYSPVRAALYHHDIVCSILSLEADIHEDPDYKAWRF